MNNSLCVVLPVHNAQRTLHDHVAHWLEMASEITPRFELLLVDDGSTDHTDEVAGELTRNFPQVRVVRHGCRRGHEQALQAGLAACGAEIIFLTGEGVRPSPADLQRLWQLRDDPELVMAQVQNGRGGKSPRLIHRLTVHSARRGRSGEMLGRAYSVQMLRRSAFAIADCETQSLWTAPDGGRIRTDQPAGSVPVQPAAWGRLARKRQTPRRR